MELNTNHEVFSIPRIGDRASAFRAKTTVGSIYFPCEYSGKWVMLFSYPTCLSKDAHSELFSFATIANDYKELNCELIGLSVDRLPGHTGRLSSITRKIETNGTKKVKINFPLVDDFRMEISRKYGMIHNKESETKAERAAFFIDPDAIIRAIVYFPESLGYNPEEFKRIILSLQAIDNHMGSRSDTINPVDAGIAPVTGIGAIYSSVICQKNGIPEKCDCFFCASNLA